MLQQFADRTQTAEWEENLQEALGEPTFVPGQSNAFRDSMNQAMRAGMAAFSMTPTHFIAIDKNFARALVLFLSVVNVGEMTPEQMIESLKLAQDMAKQMSE